MNKFNCNHYGLEIVNIAARSNKLIRKISYLLLLSSMILMLSACSKNSKVQDNIGTPSNSDDTNNNDNPNPNDKDSNQDHLAKSGDPVYITKNGVTCTIDSGTGLVTQIKSEKQTIDMNGIIIDVGYNGAYLFNQLGYTSFEELVTWQLPIVWPKLKKLPDYQMNGITETEHGFIIEMTHDSLTVAYHYEILDNTLKVYAVLTTTQSSGQLINGVGFFVKGIQSFDKESTTVEFPGSTPAGRISLDKYSKYASISTDYASPMVQFKQNEDYINILFVNEQEKWTTGAYSDEEDKPCSIFLSAVEGYLSAGEEMVVGNMYIQLIDKADDPYLVVQDFWADLGYHVPTDGVNDGPVYSTHPYGTMDTGYFNRLTLSEYANDLDRIASMGFKNVWLLPIFHHTGSNVYEPIDQGVIDQRYGGEEGAKTFINKAHELNLRVLFDLVPHGPRPQYAFAKEHNDWISKDRSGNNQIEWECVSFDYNNPGYYDYTVGLLEHYAKEFGLDGARIDCAMGGLSNWSPVKGLRASSSSLSAGLNTTKATREGFIKGGVNPVLLPENFHPVPTFAEYTDMFYDMPLFRVLFNLNHSGCTEAEYVEQLQRWLEAENKTSVKGQVKLRFLGNHDTVSWTFDAERAQTFYGTEKAKALWSILSFIDGVPFIYQGDENPSTYKLAGENIEQFFTDIFAARENYLVEADEISYIYTDTPIFAFHRTNADGDNTKLVLVNLSSSSNTYDLGESTTTILYAGGQYTLDGSSITLAPYTSIIIE